MRDYRRRLERLEERIHGSDCICQGFDVTTVADDDPRIVIESPLPLMCPKHVRPRFAMLIDLRWPRPGSEQWRGLNGAAGHA